MNKLLSLLLLIDGLTIIFTLCPDSPTLPGSIITSNNAFTVTPTSSGMTNFPSNSTELSFTMTVTPTNSCTTGSTFNVFSLTITLPSGDEKEIIALNISCTGSGFFSQVRGDYSSSSSGGSTAFSSVIGPMSVFFTLDLANQLYKYELLTRTYQETNSASFSISDSLSFNASTKLYICSGNKGTAPTNCTISDLKLFYTYFGTFSSLYGYAGGATPETAAFFPVVGGLYNTIDSSRYGYYGDNSTSSTIPSWDPTGAYITIATTTQYINFPMPSISNGWTDGISYSFAITAWIRVAGAPQPEGTIMTILANDFVTPRFRLGITYPAYQLTFYIGSSSVTPSYLSSQQLTLNLWTQLGMAIVIRGDNNAVFGSMFTSQQPTEFFSFSATVSLASTDILRIGADASSFLGSVSTVRIITPAVGFIRDSSLACESVNGIELGIDSFPLTCSSNSSFNSLDMQCYDSCPNGTGPVTYASTSLCVACNSGCAHCPNRFCESCLSNYLFYDPSKTCYHSGSCPGGTYGNATNCIDCPGVNCNLCDSTTSCTQCDASYLLHAADPDCYTSGTCPSRTFPNATHCVDCTENCAECDSTGCLTCYSDFLIHAADQNCYTNGTCPSATYPNASNYNCVDCPAYCGVCNSTACTLCISPMVLVNGSCQCPTQTVWNTSTSTCDFVSYIDLIYQSPASPYANLYIEAQILPQEEKVYPAVISWVITSNNATDLTLLTSLQTALSSQTTRYLFVLSSNLQAYTYYIINASYTNPQGKYISTEGVLQIAGDGLGVSFDGGPSQILDYSQANTITAAVLSSTGDIASSSLSVQWTTTNSSLNLASLTSSQAPFLLTIPKCTFLLGNNYFFTITVKNITSSTNSSTNLAVVSLTPRLIVTIPDGNRGQNANTDLRLTSVLSVVDPCNLASLSAIADLSTRQDAWECTKINSQGVSSICNDPQRIFVPPQGITSITVPSSYFSQDIGAQYFFKLTVAVIASSSSSTVFVATNQTSFTIMPADSPAVSLPQKVFGVPSTYQVLLSSSAHTYTYNWVFTPNVEYVYFTNSLKVLSDLTQFYPLTNVRAKMIATNELGNVTSLYLQLPINQPPLNGAVTVLPTSGTSLGTVFFITTSGWIDEDIPLTYQFLYSQNATSGYKALGSSQLASSLSTRLASSSTSSYVYVKAIVTDTFGGTGSNYTQVTVTANTDVSQTTSAILDLLNLGLDISPAQMTNVLGLASNSLSSLESAYLSSGSTTPACPLCSGHGNCLSSSNSTNSTKCVCDSGYTLSDCSMPQAQFDSILSTKLSVLNVMLQTINRAGDMDSTTKEMLGDSLDSLSSNPTFNNLQTMTVNQNSIERALNLYNSATLLSSAESTSVTNVLSSMLTYSSGTDTSLSGDFSQGLESRMNQYVAVASNSLLNNKLVGDNHSIITTTNFGMNVFRTTLCNLSGLNLAISPDYPSIQINLSANYIPNSIDCNTSLDVRFYNANSSLFDDPNRTIVALQITNSETGQSIDTNTISVKAVPPADQGCPVNCDKFEGECLCADIFDIKAQFSIIFRKSNLGKLGNVSTLLSSLLTAQLWKSLPVWTVVSFTIWFVVTLVIIKKNPNYSIANKYRDTHNKNKRAKFEKLKILLMITHPILSIYFYKNSQISKLTKLILYYQQIVLLLAFTAIFPTAGSEKVIGAKIILIIVKSITVTPLVFTIAILIKDSDPEQNPNWFQRHRKKMGIALAILSTIGAIYIIFVVAAQVDTTVQNQWTVNFLIVLIQGILISPPLTLGLQIWLVIQLAASKLAKTSFWKKKVLPRLVNDDIDKLYKRVYLGKAKSAFPMVSEQRGIKNGTCPTFGQEPEFELELEEVPGEAHSLSDLPSNLKKSHNREIKPVKMLSSGKPSRQVSGELSPTVTHINFTVNHENSPLNNQDSEDRGLRDSGMRGLRIPSTPTRRSTFSKSFRVIQQEDKGSIQSP